MHTHSCFFIWMPVACTSSFRAILQQTQQNYSFHNRWFWKIHFFSKSFDCVILWGVFSPLSKYHRRLLQSSCSRCRQVVEPNFQETSSEQPWKMAEHEFFKPGEVFWSLQLHNIHTQTKKKAQWKSFIVSSQRHISKAIHIVCTPILTRTFRLYIETKLCLVPSLTNV